MNKSYLGGKSLFQLIALMSHLITERNQGRNLEAGADAEALGCAAYRFASPGMFSLLSYTLDPPPALGWHCPQCAVPSHINH